MFALSPPYLERKGFRQILRRGCGRGRSIATGSQENILEWGKGDHNTASTERHSTPVPLYQAVVQHSAGKMQSSPNCTPNQLRVSLSLRSEPSFYVRTSFHLHIAQFCQHWRYNRQQEATTMAEIVRSSGALVALDRTRTVGDCFSRLFCNWARDEPSSLLTEIAMTHSKSTAKSLNFSFGMRWLRVAMDIRSATRHHLERRCFVCREPKELKFAANLANTQSCRAIPLIFPKVGKRSDFLVVSRDMIHVQKRSRASACAAKSCWVCGGLLRSANVNHE